MSEAKKSSSGVIHRFKVVKNTDLKTTFWLGAHGALFALFFAHVLQARLSARDL